MMRATDLAHAMMRKAVQPGDWAVDATLGNGHDTVVLAGLVGPAGRVFAFDVQQAALASAASRLDDQLGDWPQVSLIHAGHEELARHLPQAAPDAGLNSGPDTGPGPGPGEGLAGAMFNLGYLPGGDKAIVTGAQTTLAGLHQALDRLRLHGLVTLVLYPGHPGGAQEAAAVRTYAERLDGDFAVTRYARVDAARPAPELVAIERVGGVGRRSAASQAPSAASARSVTPP